MDTRDPTPFVAALAARLAQALLLHPVLKSQKDLALHSGVPRATVSRIFRGESEPSLRHLLALARSLGVSVDSLLSGAPEHMGLGLSIGSLSAVTLTSQQEATIAPIQRALLATAVRLTVAGKLTDWECLEVLNRWKGLLGPPTSP